MTRPILCARWGSSNGQPFVPECDQLSRLLERAAVIAAREDSPAQKGIREAIESLKEKDHG